MKKFSAYLFICLSVVSDAFFIGAAFVCAYWIRFHWPFFINIMPITKGIPPFALYEKILPAYVFLWLVVLTYAGFYRLKFLAVFDQFLLTIKGVSLSAFFVLALTFFYRDFTYSRLVIVISWVLSLLFIYLSRELLKIIYQFYLDRWCEPNRILIIGEGKVARNLQNKLDRQNHCLGRTIETVGENVLKEILLEEKIDQVICASSVEREKILKYSLVCDECAVAFKFAPDLLEFYLGEIKIDEHFNLPLVSLRSVSLQGANFYFKRVLDVIVATIVISFFVPFLMLTAILIKLETEGPIFYFQPRVGYRGKKFMFYKFRTMVINADVILKTIRHLSDRDGPVFKMKKDPRITRTGKFLRRYSLDELPQLINVLRGEMSLVGPRPQVIWETTFYDDVARRRLRVIPGITGLWQVSGRSDLSFEEMIQLDIYYIENWSVALDMKILYDTIAVVFLAKGAY
ncbi:MAG: sugar transferase [Elusimicrobiota bacterium]